MSMNEDMKPEEADFENPSPENNKPQSRDAKEGQEATGDRPELHGQPVEKKNPTEDLPDVTAVADFAKTVKKNIQQILIGQDKMVDLLLTGMLIEGHILLEGLPGIAKTLTAKLLAKSLEASFSRIQFTPDLMPTDITGTSIFSMKDSEFIFKKGPIFAQIILIDEINRAPAKTQAALMEVMEERQITYDGIRYAMERPFLVIATQNPIEQEGTYALPEAQLDRFLFRIKVAYPTLDEEMAILQSFKSTYLQEKTGSIKAVAKSVDLEKLCKMVEAVHISDDLLRYIAQVVHNTRNNGDLFIGASPRASLAIMQSAKAMAAIKGRGFVTPDDIKSVSVPVLNHRLILSHEREMEGITVEDVITQILEEIDIPR